VSALTCPRCARPIAATDLRVCLACQAKFCSYCARSPALAAACCPSCQSEKMQAPFVPFSDVQYEPQWYETPPGQQRLALEYAEIKRRGVAGVTTAILPDRRLLFRFPLRNERDAKFLTVITRSNHPTSYPEVILESEDAVVIPERDLSGLPRRLYVVVQRSQALDRYQRAVSRRPIATVDYFECYRTWQDFDFAAAPGATPWYGTDLGKRRLSDEISALKNAELKFESRLLTSGDVAFVFDGALLNRPEPVVAVFPSEYPNVSASITIGRESVQLSNPIDRHSPPFLGTAPLLVEVLALKLGERW